MRSGNRQGSGLDQFSRIIDSRWKKSSTDLDRVQYGYDRASNRTYREVPTDSSNKFDELYSHDGLYRLEDLKRGQLNGTHTGMTSTDFQQAWTLDETGNWSNFKQDDNGNGTWDLEQDRTANKVNEITVVNNTTGSPWGSPQYDKAGNMTRIPDPQVTEFGWNEMTVDNWYDLTVDEWYGLPVTGGQVAVYDAWNRLVRLDRDGTTLQATAYDALRRRIVVESYTDGTLDETRHTFFSAAWQAIEERVDSDTTAERQNVWGLRYIDDLILRDRDTTGNGTLDERLYALQDANWNVTSICNTSGTLQERYAYNAYGVPIFLDTAYARKSSSSYDWTTLFTGYHWDSSTGLYTVRHRTYSPQLGTWMQRDPIGYAGHQSLYDLFANSPTSRVDPSGLLDCNCNATAKGLRGSMRELINDQVNDWLRLTYPRGTGVSSHPLPPDQLTAEDLERWRLAFWMIAAQDTPSYANIVGLKGLPVTSIEAALHSHIGQSPAITSGGRSRRGATLADCMRIECDGAVYIIGSDKVGHMLQQGHMLFEIAQRAPDPRFAKAFAQWTEGLPISPAVPGVHKWLKTGKFYFFGHGGDEHTDVPLVRFLERWGGQVIPLAGLMPLDAQRSQADVNANILGQRLWQDLARGQFSASAAFYASGNSGPVATRQFDICHYLKMGLSLVE